MNIEFDPMPLRYQCTITDVSSNGVSLENNSFPIIPRVGDHVMVRSRDEYEYVEAPVTKVVLGPQDDQPEIFVDYPKQSDGSPW